MTVQSQVDATDVLNGLTLTDGRRQRAQAVAKAGGVEAALVSGILPSRINTTLSEALVLGLLRQGVTRFLCVLGHGSTEIGEVLRIYEEAGTLRCYAVRHEVEASHAASALRWVTGEKAAVVTSIGPGMLHALAGSIVPASDGLGVWYLFGDETTHDEGPNMQQIPKPEQQLYLRLCATMGAAYCLHTPEALGPALRRGLNTVDHPYRAGPFYLLIPINTQPASLPSFNLDELPVGPPPPMGAAGDDATYRKAAEALIAASRVVVKLGGGARDAAAVLPEFLDLSDGVAVLSPNSTGIVPDLHPRNMAVGGSKGSLSGNYAMETADLLVAIGTRFVCQSDCSRTGYPNTRCVININADLNTATHYGRTIALVGDAAATLRRLIDELKQLPPKVVNPPSRWLRECRQKRNAWDRYKDDRYRQATLDDPVWGAAVFTQPAAIKIATDWARGHEVVTFFDGGDVQANGFQVVEDDRLGRTFTESGASYMGFAVSALLATAITCKPFYAMAITGDGSFTMNPQILIDGAEHGARGCILLLDNRRMGAISSLQVAQYGIDHATRDHVAVDYVAWARAVPGVLALEGGCTPASLHKALEQARDHIGLSLIHLPVYWGPHELGGLGAWGRWNVGNWVHETQSLCHELAL